MTNEIKVVVEPEVKERVYNMGYDEFDGMDVVDPDEFDFSYFTESARWANHIAPRLRAMAGARHTKGGTYTDHGDIVVVDYPDDRPMDGEITESQYLYDELVDLYRYGAYDAVDGRIADAGRYDI